MVNSSKLILGIAVVAALPLLSHPQNAEGTKEERYAHAMQTLETDLEQGRKEFCDLAKEDPSFKPAVRMCTLETKEVDRQNKIYDDRFNEGINAYNAGSFDQAAEAFKKVKGGPHHDEAKNYLELKIPQKQREVQLATQQRQLEQQMEQKFADASRAYQQNDFANARAAFSQITSGAHASEAAQYVERIDSYQRHIATAETAMSSKDAQTLKKAEAEYRAALAIKNDGPGDPQSALTRLQQQIAALSKPQVQPEQPQEPAKSDANASQATTGSVLVAKTDVSQLLRDAERAEKKHDSRKAISKYRIIMALDKENAEAKKALDRLTTPDAAPIVADEDADALLAKGISEFYLSKFRDAEFHIAEYLDFKGGKAGLAHFYCGASLVTRFYLLGQDEKAKSLLQEARGHFREAKGDPKFKVPERYISPKIIHIYQSAS